MSDLPAAEPPGTALPAPPPPERPEPPRLWTLVATCAALVFGVFALTLLGYVAAAFLTDGDASPGGTTDKLEHFRALLDTLPGLLLTAGVSSLWIGGIALFAAAFSPKPFLDRLQLHRAHLPLGVWVLAVVGGMATSEASDAFLQWSGLGRGDTLNHMFDVLKTARGPGLVLAVVTIGGLAGLAEELFFRGYLQSRLVERLGPVFGIAIAAGLFALAHFDPRHSLFALAFGAYVGWLAWRTKSIWPGVAVHVVNNSSSTLMLAAGLGSEEASRKATGLLLVTSLAALVVVIAALRRTLPR